MHESSARQLLIKNNGTAPGFDALRFFLATIIMAWHAFSICYTGRAPIYVVIADYPFAKEVLRFLIPSFFFLGGFLVAGSADRLRSLKPFLIFRVLRIFPALMVEVILSAVILGAIVTTLPLASYYTHQQFFSYFLNMIGYVHLQLPGVFTGNTSSAVNINLWTLPPDFYSYLILALIMALGIFYKRRYFLILFLAGSLGLFAFFAHINQWGAFIAPVVHESLFVYSFFIGVLCYLYADIIPIKKSLFALAFAGLSFLYWDETTILGIFACCYVTLFLGMCDLTKIPLIRSGDYSYGIYLYGFPIEQTVWHYLPHTRDWVSLFVVAFPITLGFSILSWHFVEKPFLALKKHFRPREAQ